MERTRKSWGIKNQIFRNDLNEISLLELEPNQRCSWHDHQTKFNRFYVISGVLYIKLEDGTTEVKPGQIFTTVPGEMHEFQTHELPALVIEVMYVKYDDADIRRESIGGKLEDEDEDRKCPCGGDWILFGDDPAGTVRCSKCGQKVVGTIDSPIIFK